MYGAGNERDGGEERDGEGVEGCGARMDGALVAAVGVLRFSVEGRWGRCWMWRDDDGLRRRRSESS